MKNRILVLIASLTILLIAAIFVIVLLIAQNKAIKKHLPYLTHGETIKYFDLVNLESEKVDAVKLNAGRISLIFIFDQPCSYCSGNILYWRRIAGILKEKVDIYGMIPGAPSKLSELHEKARLNFKVFVPDDLDKLKKQFRLKMNLAQTILYVDGKVSLLKIGKLDGESYTEILSKTKKILKKQSQKEDNKP